MSTAQTSCVPLANYTTLRLGGPASSFAVASSEQEAIALVRAADEAEDELLLIGGGSNLVIDDRGFSGQVVQLGMRGWRIMDRDAMAADEVGGHELAADEIDAGELETPEGGQISIVEAAAGHNWDDFVAQTVASGLGGLECLSGIPGAVGASPIQNVGAYGVEVEQVLRSIRFYDRRTGQVRTISNAELGFGYRTSVLRGTDAGIVLSVRFALSTNGLSRPIRYAELARALDVEVGAQLPADQVRAAVLELRRRKGMVLDPNDHDTWSAGSFFTNPIIAESSVPDVLARIAAVVGPEVAIPRYPAVGGSKLSAAWLIERAGFTKGYSGPGGRVSLSRKHTLALTNRGQASTADLLALAREVRDGVRARFGIELHPEPLLINCSL